MSLDQPEIKTETEMYTCRCGTPFERTYTLFGTTKLGPKLCPVCDEKLTEEERERGRRLAAATDAGDPLTRLAAAGVNVRKFGRLTLAQLGNTPAVEAARKFSYHAARAGAWEFVQGLYLAGPTGVGKSQLAVATLRHLLEQGYRGRVVFDRGRSLITTIQDRYGTGTVDAVIDARRTAGVWLLDDIGTEKPTPDAFRILEDILDAREGHPTILTSNLEPEDLANHWAPQDTAGRLWSRLGPANYRAVMMEGEDRRFAA